MKTYNDLVRDLEEINELEEGKLAKALAITALGLGLYGASKPPMDMDKIHDKGPTPAAHVMTTPTPAPIKMVAPDVQGKASGLSRLLNALAEKRRKKKEQKDNKKDPAPPPEPESPIPYVSHENPVHMNLDFDT